MKVLNVLTFLVCGVVCLAVVVSGETGVVAEELRILLQEETTLRERLEARVTALRTEAIMLNRTIVPCQCNYQSSNTAKTRHEVAFTGTLPSTMTSLTTSSQFTFKNDLINIGRPFNVTSGRFVVPVSGLYGFSLTIYMGSASYWTAMELVKNGQQFVLARTGHYSGRQVNMATNYGLVNATAGDEIWPRFVSSSGTRLYADGVSTFSGVLLSEH